MKTILEMIETIDKPEVKELMLALHAGVGPTLEKAENDIISGMDQFGGQPSPSDEEQIRMMVRREGFKVMLMTLQEHVEKAIAAKKEAGETS